MILVLVLALATTNAATCPTITCGPNEGTLCYTYTNLTNSGVTSQCAADHHCNFDYSTLQKSFLCVPDTGDVEDERWPGQKCSDSKICKAGATCDGGYCKGVALGNTCTSTDVCAPGAYCKMANLNNGTCTALIQENQPCVAEYSCDYGHSCYSGVCKKQNVANNQVVDATSCLGYPIGGSPLCISQQCLKFTNGTAKCIAAYKSVGSYIACETCDGTSSSSGTVKVTQNCTCGLSGSQFCPGFYGDTYQSKALSIGYEYLFGQSVRKCNIKAGYACMEDYWDRDDYIEYSYYSMRAADNYMLHNGPECVLSALATSYYKVKAEYEDSSSSSSSFGQLFAVSALVFTVIA